MTTNLALAIGIMVTVGLLGGVISNRMKFPRVTGYIVVGILLSPSAFNLITRATIDQLDIITNVTLGIVAYLIGASLRVESIRRLGKSIAWITPFQSLGAWLLSTLILAWVAPYILNIPGVTFSNGHFPVALVIGAMAAATAPAAVMAIIRELKARGPFTTTLLAVVGLDDAIAVLAFAVAVGIARPLISGQGGISVYEMLGVPAMEIGLSIAIGIGLGFLLVSLTRLARTRAMMLSAVLGVVILCTGLAGILGISLIMANMTIGFIVANRMTDNEPISVIEGIEETVFAVFFVFSGMHFDTSVIRTAGLLATVIFATGFAGKYLGTRIGARISNAPDIIKKYLGLALLPKAGVTLGLALLAKDIFPVFGDIIFNGVLVSVIINELVAPPLVRYAIIQSGEAEES